MSEEIAIQVAPDKKKLDIKKLLKSVLAFKSVISLMRELLWI